MYQRNCPKTIDKPITILGMEMEDLAVLVIGIGIMQIVVGGPIALVLGLTAMIILKRIKRGRPRGYLLHLLYHKGMSYQKTLPPMKKVRRYTPSRPVRKIKGVENIFREKD